MAKNEIIEELSPKQLRNHQFDNYWAGDLTRRVYLLRRQRKAILENCRRIAVVGASSGNAVLLACIALGLGWILKTSAEVFDTLRWVGAAYLIWLGIQAWRHAGTMSELLRLYFNCKERLPGKFFAIVIDKPGEKFVYVLSSGKVVNRRSTITLIHGDFFDRL